MIKLAVEPLRSCIDELLPLLEKHFEEVNFNKEDIPHEPDWDGYMLLENSGMLHVVTAREEDGRLLGYCSTLINTSLHHRHNVFGVNDALYIIPEYRGTGLAYDMFQFVFASLKELGVDTVHISMKVTHPFDGLCKKLGMQLEERLYSLYIGE